MMKPPPPPAVPSESDDDDPQPGAQHAAASTTRIGAELNQKRLDIGFLPRKDGRLCCAAIARIAKPRVGWQWARDPGTCRHGLACNILVTQRSFGALRQASRPGRLVPHHLDVAIATHDDTEGRASAAPRAQEPCMTVDIPTLFNEKLPGALTRNAQDVRTINAKFHLNIQGVGEWFIDTTETGPSCVAGNPGGAACSMTMSAEDFQKLHENPQANGMLLYSSGRLNIEGNPMLAMKLAKLFSYS